MDLRRAQHLAMGVGLLMIPWLAYPGNWSSTAPSSPAAQMSWTVDAVLVYLTILLGAGWLSLMVLGEIRRFRNKPDGIRPPWLGALAGTLLDRTSRIPLVLAASAYGVFFSFFTGLVAIIPSASSTGEALPSISTVLCCGPPGITPGVVVLVTPNLQLAANPATLLLLAAGLPLFAANVASAAWLVRRGRSAGRGALTGTAGALGTLLLNCPSCGTILLANALAGTAAAGALVGLTAVQTPLLLAAFPMAIGSLWLAGRQIARPAGCVLPSNTLR